MATGSMITLQNEIHQLEQDLARRRRALEILQQGMAKPAAAAAARPIVAPSGQPLITTRTAIQKLFTTAPSLRLTSKEIRERLQQQRLSVTPKTVQRQLRALVQAKVVRAHGGQYSLAPKSPAKPSAAPSKAPSKGPAIAATAKPAPTPAAQAVKQPAAKTTKS